MFHWDRLSLLHSASTGREEVVINQKLNFQEDLKHWRLAQLGIFGPLTSCMEKEKGRLGERERRREKRGCERERGGWRKGERMRREIGEREDEREKQAEAASLLEPRLGNHITSFLPHSVCSGGQGLTWIQGDGLSLTGSTFWEGRDKENMWEQKC